MKDNILKKQFSEKDVQRMRNLIQGKYGEKTTIGVGFTKNTEQDYVEGDIWDENGRKWTIKNGIKENITKLDKFKNLSIPLFCPSCNGIMNKQQDSTYYKSYGCCLNCRASFETKLKLEGKWEEYKIQVHNDEIDILIQEYTNHVMETINESNQGFIAENGDIEKWDGKINNEKALSALDESIEYLKSLKK